MFQFICANTAYATFTDFVPAPCLRKSFILPSSPSRAALTVCAPGFYDLWVNGQRLTKGLIAPYVSNPDDLLYYDEYDVLPFLRDGENVLGLVLGNGMLNCIGGGLWDLDQARWRCAPCVGLRLTVGLTDQTDFVVESDASFKTSASPIVFNDLRAGEWYDARMEQQGWCAAGFDDSAWLGALPALPPRGEYRRCEAEPVVITRELSPVSVCRGKLSLRSDARNHLLAIEPEADENAREGWLYDFGENVSGVCRLRIQGRKGQKIVLQFCEALAEDGGLDLRGMTFLPRRFNHRDVYICRGEGVETWSPVFTYHGFRYCLALNLEDSQALPETLCCCVAHSALVPAGRFHCSDEAVNAIQRATVASDLGNFCYFPTDCPHREKNGWTADAALSCEQMLYNLHAEKSLAEWLRSIRKAQAENGALPGIVPTGGWGFEWGNGPAWDSVITYLPYSIWRLRGDTQVVRDNACSIMRYLEYISRQRDERGLLHIGLGDWCHAGRYEPQAPLEFTDTAVSMHICRQAETMLRAASLALHADFAASLYASLRASARAYLIDAPRALALGDCQTTQAMAIDYNLFDAGEKHAAFDQLLRMIHRSGDHLDVGVLGGRVLFRVLADYGETELALKLILGPGFPSYGYWMAQGATTLFENFQPREMRPVSQNHHFWGDVSAWFYEYLAGIRVNPQDRDCREVLLAPFFPSSLKDVQAETDTVCGRVGIHWHREGGTVRLDLNVPEGIHGMLRLPPNWKTEAEGMNAVPLRAGSIIAIPFDAPDAKQMEGVRAYR